MELVHGTRKTSKFAPEDSLSSMPDNVITNILDRLPLQDAVRTSILSINWRFKWTMLSQLVFDSNFFVYLGKTHYSHGKIISRIFLQLRGAITKCVLCIDFLLDLKDISYWIAFLSRNEIKDLTFGSFISYPDPLYKLPIHFFSCLGLKRLELVRCRIHPPTTFHGFPNLLTLELFLVQSKSRQIGEFIMLCPALEILKLKDPNTKVKLDDIAKHSNLRTLSLFLLNFDANMTTKRFSTVSEVVRFLPKLQELDLGFRSWQLTEGGAKKRFLAATAAMPCLKALKLSDIDNLTIATRASNVDSPPQVVYSTIGLLQLQSAVFIDLKGSENEVCLIKYLLACSPFLKKIVIRPHFSLEGHVPVKFAMQLLNLHRAYPGVDIGLY